MNFLRRIDSLGRIVIPKELRENLKIHDGDSFEISVGNNKIVLKKYSVIDLNIDFFQKIIDSYYQIYKKDIVITNKELITNVTLGFNNYKNCKLSENIKNLIKKRISKEDRNIIVDDMVNYYFIPLIVNSDAIGSIILISENITNGDICVLNFLKTFLIKNIEE